MFWLVTNLLRMGTFNGMTPPIQEPGEGLNAAVAAELRAEQGRRKLSVPALAELADIPYGSLRRYLNAERHIDVSILAALCSAMGISPGDVIVAAAASLKLEAANPGDVVLFPGRAAQTFGPKTDVSGEDFKIEDLYDEPSAAHPLPRKDVEGDLDPDLQ